MPPEQLDPLRRPNSYAADVWSLGCVLMEIAALKPAFADYFGEEVRGRAGVRAREGLWETACGCGCGCGW